MEFYQKHIMKFEKSIKRWADSSLFRKIIRRNKMTVEYKSYFLLSLFVMSFWTNFVHAATYYVSTSGANGNPGTQALPWNWSRFSTNLTSGVILAGDSVLFKRGDFFNNSLQTGGYAGGSARNGTVTNPIYFGAYGTGAKPRMVANTRTGVFHVMRKNYWVWDNINFQDLTFSASDKLSIAPCATGIRLGDFGSDAAIDKTNNHVIKNCDFNNIGLGVVILGDNNLVDSCTFVNLKNVVNTPNTGGSTAYEDYGANAITLCGSNNQFLHGYYESNWCESYDFGYSGGANEMFGSCFDNLFAYNTYVDCGGIAEFGSQGSGDTSRRNKYAYNKIIECGSMSYISFNNVFVCVALDNYWYNNVFVETSASRFSGINAGTGIVTAEARSNFSPDVSCLAFSAGSPAQTIFYLKNNIFWFGNANFKCFNSTTVGNKTDHTNNIFQFKASGATAGVPLNPSELSTTGVVWNNTTGATSGWDFKLPNGSLGIDFGTNLGFTQDFAGVAVTNPPNAGIFEQQQGSTLVAASSFTPILCNGGTSTVTVTATGGTAPYTGTGTFTRSAGGYSYVVTDALGATSTTSGTIIQPTLLVASNSFSAIVFPNLTTNVLVTASGGTPPYFGTGTFGRTAGAFSYTVTDANGCTSGTSGTVAPVVQPVQTFIIKGLAPLIKQ